MTQRYAKPNATNSLPAWYKQIRAGSNFMPSQLNLKPLSYNYMADWETPNRKAIYGANNPSIDSTRNSLAATGTGPVRQGDYIKTNLGTYYMPTDKVTTGIKRNASIIQSVESLGANVGSKAISLFTRLGDVLSRPQYAYMNQYKSNMEYWFKGENSAGGSDVTGLEHVGALLTGVSGIGTVFNLLTGRQDDIAKAQIAGWTGKEKTLTKDILKEQVPGFVENHSKLASVASFAGDVLLDPINFVGVAAVPGSITKLTGSTGLKLLGKDAEAARLWNETFFSKAGREAALNTVRRDILNKESKKLAKQARKVAKSKKLPDAVRTQKAAQLQQAAVDKLSEDLKGATFALKLLKRSAPTLGIGTVSRLSVAAGAGNTALKGARTIKDVQALNTADAVETLRDSGTWKAIYKMYKDTGTNIEYTHAGITYSVKLSEAKGIDEFLTMVINEGASLASYAEHSKRAARARKGHIVGVEARSAAFMDAWRASNDAMFKGGLNAAEYDEFARLKNIPEVVRRANDADANAMRLVDEKKVVVIDEAALYETPFNDLRKSVVEAAGEGYTGRHVVVVRDTSGNLKTVPLANLKTRAQNLVNNASSRMLADARRTPEMRAADALAGISERAATTRERVLSLAEQRQEVINTRQAANDAANTARAAGDTADSAADAAGEMLRVFDRAIGNINGLSDEEKVSLLSTLRDESLNPAERVSAVLSSNLLDNETANAVFKDFFRMGIENDTVLAAMKGEGSGLESLPKIFNMVIENRWGARVSEQEKIASGTNFDDVMKRIIQVNNDNPNYTRDIHGEIGLMVMDAYRAALDIAVQQELMSDPDTLFRTINTAMDDFMNQASADTKAQVMQLMYNLTGMRLPEKFVPMVSDLADIKSTFKFTDAKGVPLENQEQQWANLGATMQRWVVSLFPSLRDNIPNLVVDGTNVRSNGLDITKLRQGIDDLAKNRVEYDPSLSKDVASRAAEKITGLRARIYQLQGVIDSMGDGAIDGQRAVNRYDLLDFLMHDKSILDSQETTLRIQAVGNGQYINRVNMGRLSALDSFTFISEDAQDGLKAIKELKRLMSSGKTTPEIREAARAEFAALFIEAGGKDYLDLIEAPAKDVDFESVLSRLGTHARIKEEAVGTASGFDRKYRADLMDHLWGNETLMSEWQKAVQTKILHGVYVEGMTKEESAKKLAENLTDTFKNHDRIKRMLYPVGKRLDDERLEKSPIVKGTKYRADAELQKDWGGNQFSAERNSPMVTDYDRQGVTLPEGMDSSTPFGFKDVVNNGTSDVIRDNLHSIIDDKTVIDKLVPFKGVKGPVRLVALQAGKDKKIIGYASRYTDSMGHGQLKIHMLHEPGIVHKAEVTDSFRSDIRNVLQGKKYTERHDPRISADAYTDSAVLKSGVKEVEPARYRADLGPDNPDVIRTGDALAAREDAASATAQAAAAQGRADEAVLSYVDSLKSANNTDEPVAAMRDSDFANIPGTEVIRGLTEEDKRAIVEYIRQTKEDANAEQVAMALHGASMSLTSDVMRAQATLIMRASDMSIKHGRTVRFAGVPLMHVGGPGNATHTVAGVSALDQEASRATRFFGNLLQPATPINSPSRTGFQNMYMKYARQSHVLEGSLDRIRMGVVNAASIHRKKLISELNSWYKSINKAEFKNATLTAKKPRKRAEYLSRVFFDPNYGKTPDRLTEFDTVTGENIPYTIQANLEDIADQVFGSFNNFGDIKAELKTFNRYMTKKYRLTDAQIDVIYNSGRIKPDMLPYTREWLIEVGKILPDSKLNSNSLVRSNLALMHYAIQDAKLKIKTGKDLHFGVFDQFAFRMESDLVAFHNKHIVPQTVDGKGNTMRGEFLNIRDIANKALIDPRYIPAQFKTGEYYISEDMVPDIKLLFEYMDEVSSLNDTLSVGVINKILNLFKASVTIYKLPTYPVRNLVSDVFMSAMDGLTNPRYYKEAIEIMNENHAAMKRISLDDYAEIMDESLVTGELTRAAHDTSSWKPINKIDDDLSPRLVFTTDDGSITLNGSQIVHEYDRLGLGQNRVTGEFVETVAATRQSGATKVGGAIHDKLKDVNDVREDWARLAHFIFAIEKEAPLGGSLEDVLRRAGDRVIKYHFDYGDVSLWERGSLSKHIPFYKWVRNVVPFTIASVLTAPRYINIEQALGELTGNLLNDDPDEVGYKDLVLPEYIERESATPVGWFMNNAGNKFNQYVVMSFPLSETLSKTIAPSIEPWIDGDVEGLGNKFEESGKGAATTAFSMTTPVHKGAAQAIFGKTVWPTGTVPEGASDSWMKTMSAVIPGFPALDSAMDSVKAMQKDDTTGSNTTAKWMDSFGLLNLYNNSESSQLGALRQEEDKLTAKYQKVRGELSKKLTEKFPNMTPEQADELLKAYVAAKKKATNG